MRVLSLPSMILSSSLKAAMTRGSDLVMPSGNVVFLSIEIQSTRAVSQCSAKKVNASTLTSLEATSLPCDKSPLFALLARCHLPDCLRFDTAADFLHERLRLLVLPAWTRCGILAIADDRKPAVLELAPGRMTSSMYSTEYRNSVNWPRERTECT